MTIHKTSIIDDGAIIHETAEIGPYAIVGAHVKIGAGTKVGPHAVIGGHSAIGNDCRIYAGASIGLEPQDLKYKDEPTGVTIGNNVTVREYVTIHRGTGDRNTLVGDNCFLMNYVHIAHDCKIGTGVILTNSATFAGHVEVGDYTVVSGFCVMQQFARIGRGVMLGGMSGSRVDLPPFTICDGRPATVRAINIIGLRRQKKSADVRAAIKHAYKTIYISGLNNSQAIARLREDANHLPEVEEICQFFEKSKRGVAEGFTELETDSVLAEVAVETI